MTLGERTGDRANNFDVLRLVAAVMVLVSHSFALSGQGEPHLGGLALGTLGVVVFFGISGFLIARSWALAPDLRAFLVKRALRIVPALVLALVACAYLVGPIATSLSPGDYLASPETLDYVVGNLASVVSGGLTGDIDYRLPGVFEANPETPSVNGSLWTLPVEIQAYALVVALGLLGLLARGAAAIALAGLALLSAHAAGLAVPVAQRLVEARPDSVLLLTTFAVAAVLWSRRDSVPLRLDLALAAIVVWALMLGTAFATVASAVALPYLVLMAAYRSPAGLRRVVRPGDVSYGLYVLAFPVQQAIIALWGASGPGPALLSLLALPITYGLAYASWRLVEAPALRLKSRLSVPRVRVQQAAAR